MSSFPVLKDGGCRKSQHQENGQSPQVSHCLACRHFGLQLNLYSLPIMQTSVDSAVVVLGQCQGIANARPLNRFEDDEIGLLAKQIHRYHDQLTELLLRKQEFARNVSHGLRTPVTNISLAAEVLAASEELPEKQLTRVRRIQRAAREMTELIETFLVLAKADTVDAGTASAVSVNSIVKDVVEQQRVWLHGKPVEVVVNEHGDLIVGAPGRVIAVLAANLARNAFRYTGRGSVEISIYVDRLTVDDTGPGIDESSTEKLFERHERGVTVDPDGFGLGLSIVRRICERFGWRVVVENRAKGGARFVVDFSEGGSQQPKTAEYAADGTLTNS